MNKYNWKTWSKGKREEMTDRRSIVKRWRDGGSAGCELNTELQDENKTVASCCSRWVWDFFSFSFFSTLLFIQVLFNHHHRNTVTIRRNEVCQNVSLKTSDERQIIGFSEQQLSQNAEWVHLMIQQILKPPFLYDFISFSQHRGAILAHFS